MPKNPPPVSHPLRVRFPVSADPVCGGPALRQYENRIVHQLPPFTAASTLRTLVDHLIFMDTFGIFLVQPDIAAEHVAAYRKVVSHPMCFTDINTKLDAGEYSNVNALRYGGVVSGSVAEHGARLRRTGKISGPGECCACSGRTSIS